MKTFFIINCVNSKGIHKEGGWKRGAFNGYLPIMPVNARDSAGTSRDKQGQVGTSREKAGTNRDKKGNSLSVPACPYLFMSVPVCPCLSLSVPVCV